MVAAAAVVVDASVLIVENNHSGSFVDTKCLRSGKGCARCQHDGEKKAFQRTQYRTSGLNGINELVSLRLSCSILDGLALTDLSASHSTSLG